MKSFQASITINASPQKVWEILTRAEDYPQWDPGMDHIEGTIAPGEHIKVFTKINPERTFPVTVKEFVPGKKMTWVGGMPLGLFKGVRTFTLTSKGENQVEFNTREEFTGPLLGLFAGSIPDLSEDFQNFVNGLKARAESA